MKKIILTIIICLGLNLPLKVKADVGAPILQEYDAIVVNVEGSKLYEGRYADEKYYFQEIKTIPQGTKVTIVNEGYYENDWYGYAKVDGDRDYYIKLKDLMLANAKFDLSKANKLEEKEEVIVIGDNVYLYNGPSKMYSKVTEEIPKNTHLTYEYTDGTNLDSPGTVWVYTEYNGQKGWLYTYQQDDSFYEGSCGIANIEEDSIYILKDITTIYDYPSKKANKISVNIPQKEEINTSYHYGIGFFENGDWVYITYNNQSGWLNLEDDEAAEKDSFKGLTVSNIELYAQYNNKNSKLSFKISPGEEIEILCMKDYWAYLEYKENHYWTLLTYNEGTYNDYLQIAKEEDSKEYIVAGGTINVYEQPNIKSTKIKELTLNTKVESKYFYYNKGDYWYYLEDIKGWILSDFLGSSENSIYKVIDNDGIPIFEHPGSNIKQLGKLALDQEFISTYHFKLDREWLFITSGKISGWVEHDRDKIKFIKSIIKEEEKEEEIKEPVEQPLPTIDKDKTGKKVPKLTTEEIIKISVLGAICLSLTALVTIILINKKKQKKEQNTENN